MHPSAPTAADIDALLPQTQCQRCGFMDCRAYAEALASGASELNRCVPGGGRVIDALARLLARTPMPLDPECGREEPPKLVWIDPQECIGCARCLPLCPTDAILGAQHYLHTVLADCCTGCELCLPVCPVDCIHPRERDGEPEPSAEINRARYQQHRERAERALRERAQLLAERKRAAQRPRGGPASR